MTVYRLQRPLLPKARLENMIERNHSIWFASTIGLIEFNKRSNNWLLYNSSTKLPEEAVSNLTLDNGRLFLEMSKTLGIDFAYQKSHFWFDVEQDKFEKSEKTLEQVLAKGNYKTKDSDLYRHTIRSILHYKNKVWFSYASPYKKSKTYNAGGIAALHPLSKQGIKYTVRDGLADKYCYGITESNSNSIWVTHWKPAVGLSVLYNNEKRWKNMVKSINGIELGGQKITAFEHFIAISRYKEVTLYDKVTKLAYTIDSALGLPGKTIGGLLAGSDSLWISAYSKNRRSVEIAGLLKIKFQDIRSMFERLKKAKEDNS